MLDVWRPLDQFKDAAEAIKYEPCETGFVYDVDVTGDPPHEKWPRDETIPRPKWPTTTDSGRYTYAKIPVVVLLDTRLQGPDIHIYGLIDAKSGTTPVAHLPQADLVTATRFDPKTVRASLRRLEDTGWIEQPTRGRSF